MIVKMSIVLLAVADPSDHLTFQSTIVTFNPHSEVQRN
jgi:hypothetical protein